MIAAQAKPAGNEHSILRRVLTRMLGVVVVAFLVGYGMRQASIALERDSRPAGFARGFFQGAVMPCALPNLLVGKDVSIYNENNNGVRYKLGYTCGVNACGAIFFGLFFLRLSRMRKHFRAQKR